MSLSLSGRKCPFRDLMCGQYHIAQLWFSGLSLYMKGNRRSCPQEKHTGTGRVCHLPTPLSRSLPSVAEQTHVAALPVLDSCSTKQNQVLLDLLVGFC